MAGTVDENSKLTWLRLGETRDRVVAEYTHAPQLAEGLLLDGLEQRAICWRPTWLRIDPEGVWNCEIAKLLFWQRSEHSSLTVDWANHTAVRTGPAFILGEKGAQVITSVPRTVIEAQLIDLSWDDVLRYLQSLVVSRPHLAPAPSISEPPSPATREPASPSSEPPAGQEPQQEETGRPKLLLLPEEPQFEDLRKWRPEEAMNWLKEAMKDRPKKAGESKNAWAERLYKQMKRDFGTDIPWSEWGTLRRRMNDPSMTDD
jgi:hypothetical protein